METKIPLQLVGNKVLIFDIEHIKLLRNLGILGILIGTLSKFPQQNVFLSKPLELSFCEILWLVEHKKKKNIHVNDTLITFDCDEVKDKESHQMIIEKSKICADDYIKMNVFSESQLKYLIKVYKAFKYFKSLNYFILPGLKFGGELICYPGDPLRYHSHLIVNLNELKVNSIIVGGRLATGVKKLWILVEEENDEFELNDSSINDNMIDQFSNDSKMISFSVEWAGFG